jgi:hypothetical protein
MSAGRPEIIGVMRTRSQKVIDDLFALDRQAQAMEDRAMERRREARRRKRRS